jgi:energy-coupling factor transporter ATP-binding protein EcfA2
MYLRSIKLKNTGPIQELNLTLPFSSDQPKPLVIVGRNGSGKSTVISFIVNALLAIKQQIFDDSEIEKGKVYRLRSPLGINGSSNFYFARLNFDKGVSLVEWQLDRQKESFVDQSVFLATDLTWQEIPLNETSYFMLPLGELNELHLLGKEFGNSCFLFFPADRFEPPDWLHVEGLSSELKLPETSRIKGKTQRHILARNRLKPTLEWLNSVIFDFVIDRNNHEQGRIIFDSVVTILQNILCDNPDEKIELHIGDRRSRIISIVVSQNGGVVRTVRDIMSLSAGESALFCMFSSILRDADLALIQFKRLDQIPGIVVIDEADLHLHLSLQYRVLPRLIALFPKVQFILSIHAPLVLFGLKESLGLDGFEIYELPNGECITPDKYSEFLTAFNIFANTNKFQEEVLKQVRSIDIPVLLLEGKTDALLIVTAWKKLNPDKPIPFTPVPCGVELTSEERNGGAGVLRRCLEYLSVITDKTVIAVFDNDRIGNEQFNSITDKSFEAGDSSLEKHHKQKPIYAFLLPIPVGREHFVSTNKITNRYLSIEHFFSDDLLQSNGLKGEPIIADSKVFEIDASNNIKVKFANQVEKFEASEFSSFSLLFDLILRFLSKLETLTRPI